MAAAALADQEGLIRTELRAAADRQLAAGEMVRWAGQPDPGRAALHAFLLDGRIWFALFIYLVVAITMLGFAVACIQRGTTDALVLLFVTLLSGAAIWWLVDKTKRAARNARRTLYVVTDRRVLIVEDGAIRSIDGCDLRHIEGWERRGGKGSLLLRHAPYYNADGYYYCQQTFLIGLEDVHHVGSLAVDLERARPWPEPWPPSNG